MTVLIGIMADSHGRPETILAALAVLKDLNCRSIFHLGDVCDSNHPETAEACLRPLQEHKVITIKGNNDHAIVANSIGRQKPPVSPKVLEYIQSLPLITYYQNTIFIHSLPFTDELGLSCMIGAMGEDEARRSFNEFPHQIIFRGHSHSPEIIWSPNRLIEFRPLAVGRKFDLKGKIPCVVTCGALTRGLCMVWDPVENMVESLSFLENTDARKTSAFED